MAGLLDHFFGVATETTPGLATTSSMRFHEWSPGSAMDSDPKVVEGTGIRQGSLFDRGQRRFGVVGQGGGSVAMDVLSRGMGLILGYGLGTASAAVVSGAVNQINITPALPGSGGTALTSFTAQEGIVRPDGSTDAFTFAGCAVKSFELACSLLGMLTLKADIDSRPAHVVRSVSDAVTANGSAALSSATANFTQNDVGRPVTSSGIPAGTTIAAVTSSTTATLSANATGTGTALTIGTAAATPSYPSAATTNSLHYGQLVGSLGGTLTAPTSTALASVASGTSIASLRAFSLKVDNAIDDGRWNGSQARRQPTVGRRMGTISIDTEYDSTTGALLREAQLNQTDVGPILLTFTGAYLGVAGYNEVLQLVIPSAKVDSGAIPQPSDDKTIVTSVQYKLLDNLSAAQPLWIVLRTLDTAA